MSDDPAQMREAERRVLHREITDRSICWDVDDEPLPSTYDLLLAALCANIVMCAELQANADDRAALHWNATVKLGRQIVRKTTRIRSTENLLRLLGIEAAE